MNCNISSLSPAGGPLLSLSLVSTQIIITNKNCYMKTCTIPQVAALLYLNVLEVYTVDKQMLLSLQGPVFECQCHRIIGNTSGLQ